MTSNYAVSKMRPRVYLFFNGTLPRKVAENPLEWSTWNQVENERVSRIGESPLSFCARNGHRYNVPGCQICMHRRTAEQSSVA